MTKRTLVVCLVIAILTVGAAAAYSAGSPPTVVSNTLTATVMVTRPSSGGGGGYTPPTEPPTNPPTEQNPPTFNDVPDGDWAEEAIKELASKGIIEGYGDGSFRPNNDMNRGEVAALLTRFLGIEPTGEGSINDSDGWSDGYINALVVNGLVKGYGNNEYHPSDSITRAEFVVILARAIDKGLIARPTTTTQRTFTDSDVFPEWATDAINLAAQYGIIQGYDDGSFGPDRPITRAEVAIILFRLMSNE